MAWQQLKVRANPQQLDDVESLLLAAGASAISLLDGQDQPVFQKEPGSTPLWDDTVVVALFDSAIDLKAQLYSLALEPAVLELGMPEALADQDWERSWIDRFQPQRFGRRLWICPSWQEPPDPDGVNLLLDPGLAFGTGNHATTALCLRWLDEHAPSELSIIDYGCGSGVLALAALKLGASSAMGVDNDPQALIATADNCRRNGISPEQLPCFLPHEFAPQRADLLLANILAEPLLELAPTLAALVRPGGRIVLSGLLVEQSESLRQGYKQWFNFDTDQQEQGWSLLAAIRKS